MAYERVELGTKVNLLEKEISFRKGTNPEWKQLVKDSIGKTGTIEGQSYGQFTVNFGQQTDGEQLLITVPKKWVKLV